IDVMRFAQRADLQKAGHAPAPRDVRLQDVDSVRLEHSPRIVQRVNILARGNFHLRGRAAPHQTQAGKIIRGHRLLEPPDVRGGAFSGDVKGLLDGEGTIGIDEQRTIADRRLGYRYPFRVPFRLASDLHFHRAAAVAIDPSGKLFGQLRV